MVSAGESKLSRLVVQRIAAGQFSQRDLKEALGVSLTYIGSLLNGNRSWSGVNKPALRKLALLLDLTPWQVFILAGAVCAADGSNRSAEEAQTARLACLPDTLLNDPEFCQFAPSASVWGATPKEVQRLVLRLHARAQIAHA